MDNIGMASVAAKAERTRKRDIIPPVEKEPLDLKTIPKPQESAASANFGQFANQVVTPALNRMDRDLRQFAGMVVRRKGAGEKEEPKA